MRIVSAVHAVCTAFPLALAAPRAIAVDASLERQIPSEYEATSGPGVALNNGGYAANDPVTAIRANPALMALQKRYTVSGGYHWPVEGREFFQAAVVDGKTSNIVAGASYTGYTDNYEYHNDRNVEASRFDSPVVRRGVFGLAQSFGAFSAGIGAIYVESHRTASTRDPMDPGDQRVKGVGLTGGGAYTFANGLAAGASIENGSNRKIKDYAPKTTKAGLAYTLSPGIIAMADYRIRERVAEFEEGVTDPDASLDSPPLKAEEMGILSFSAQVQDYLRLLGSYAKSQSDDRQAVAGGVALTSQNFSLSYTMARPYMSRSTTHQAVALSLDVAM